MNLTIDDEQNWDFLRERSLQPGGFGEDRVRIWPALLGAQPLSDPPPYSEEDAMNECRNIVEPVTQEPAADPHADERQIKLDTDRSFVLYPGDSGTTLTRDALQSELLELLVSLFRRRRSLRYFQGFHDIMTVLSLTLPRPLHLACAEKMALHRVRDAMGVGLEPVLGLLRVLRNLLRLMDPAYAKLLESISPLPYHALSHLLTLFSHDVPTLPLIQHVWDFLLSREPIAVVWLAAALILYRKPSVYLLAEQDEEGMIHSLLGGLPDLVDAGPEAGALNGVYGDAESGVASVKCITRSHSTYRETGLHEQQNSTATRSEPLISEVTLLRGDTSMEAENCRNQGALSSDAVQNSVAPRTSSFDAITKPSLPPEVSDQDCVSGPDRSTIEFAASIALPDSRPTSPTPSPESSNSTRSTSLSGEVEDIDQQKSSPSTSSCPLPHSCSSLDSTSPSVLSSAVAVRKSRTKHAPLSLTHLLRQADDLLTAYPPSHPFLHVAEIMGPDSVVRTWRPSSLSTMGEVPEKHEADDYWESLVNSPRIVIPSPPPSPPLGSRALGKKTRMSPRTSRRALWNPRRVGMRLGALTPAERRVLFMGALLVVGAAIALKSGKGSYVDGIIRSNGADGLKRLWNGKWTLMSSVIAAWGRGLP